MCCFAEKRPVGRNGEMEDCLFLWGVWRRFVEDRELKGCFKFRRYYFTRDGHLLVRYRKVPEEDDSDCQSTADEPESEDEVVRGKKEGVKKGEGSSGERVEGKRRSGEKVGGEGKGETGQGKKKPDNVWMPDPMMSK